MANASIDERSTVINDCKSPGRAGPVSPHKTPLLLSPARGLLSCVHQYYVRSSLRSDRTKRNEEQRRDRVYVYMRTFENFYEAKGIRMESSCLSLHRAIPHRRMFLRHRVTFTLGRSNKMIEIFEPPLAINASSQTLLRIIPCFRGICVSIPIYNGPV